MKVQRSIRRAIAWVVAVTVLAQATGCSYVPARPDERTCVQEKAEALSSAKGPARNQQAIFFNVTVDGRWRCAAAVEKNNYSVDVFVTWSDGTTEKHENAFWITTELGRQYSVMAYEVGAGSAFITATLTERKTPETTERKAPETSDVTSATTSSNNGSAGRAVAGFVAGLLSPIWVPLVIVTMPITLPLAIISSKARKDNPKQVRWNTDCCFIWIEDAETQETLYGTAPREKPIRSKPGGTRIAAISG